jgi:hypothetical protein
MDIKEQLSPNIECNWKIYKNNNIKKDYNIISVSYFSKKDKSAEKKKRYFEGLQKLYFMMKKILPYYTLRVYCDSSVISNIFEFYNKVKEENIEIFQYDIPFLHESNNSTIHKGTIGTLWRFLPLLKSKLHHCDKKLILDIDTYYNDMYLKLIKKLEDDKEKVYFMYRSHPYYYQQKRLSCVEGVVDFEYLVAHFIYQSNEIDYNILSNFLERYLVNISNQNKDKIVKKCEMISEFEYGIDETFMNEVFLPKQIELIDVNEKRDYKMYVLYHISVYDYKYVFFDFLDEIKNKSKNSNQVKIKLFMEKLFEAFQLKEELKKYSLINENQKIDVNKFIEFIQNYKSSQSILFYDKILIPLFKNESYKKKIQNVFKKYFDFHFVNPRLTRLKKILDLQKDKHFLILQKTNKTPKISYIKHS